MESVDDDFEDRPSVLLNDREREMLAEDVDVNDSVRWKRYQRIRRRVRHGIYDFGLIYQHWDEINLDKALADDELSKWHTPKGVKGALYVLYRAFSTGPFSFETLLKDAIYKAESDLNDRSVDVRFSVDPGVPQSGSSLRPAEKVTPEHVEDLSITQARSVLKALAYSSADIPELVEEGEVEIYSDDE